MSEEPQLRSLASNERTSRPVLHRKTNLVKLTKTVFDCSGRFDCNTPSTNGMSEVVVEENETSEVGEALYDFSFGIAGLERAYRTAVERLAFEAAAKCTHSYDPVVYFDAVSASVFHPDAKSVIVRDFLRSVRDLINEELGLRLEIEMTRYGGEYGRGGTVYGRIEQHMPDDEIVAQVGGILNARCGGIPDLALDFEGRYLLEWCLECIEIADSGDAEHCPEGDCAEALAERLHESGVVLDSLRSALNPNELERRLSDPDRVAAELKYRARAEYF